MDYILLNVLSGAVVEYQNGLIDELAARFNLTAIRDLGAPSHFTLKYWFKTEDIQLLERDIEEFCERREPAPVRVGGLASFGNDVIYLKVTLSGPAMVLFEELMGMLGKYDWMEWDPYDHPNLVFHATLATDCAEQFDEVWAFLKEREQVFDCMFDNVTIIMLERGLSRTGPIDIRRTFWI